MGWILGGTFALLMLLGMPIALAIGSAGLLVLLINGLPLAMLPQMMFTGNNSFALVAVPFFILAGDILARGGISERIISFAEATLGRIRGGLSMVSIVASMFIAAISGSGAATTAAVGSALLPELKERGYDLDFSAALIASSGTIGVVIPPSVPMVLYAVIAGRICGKALYGGVYSRSPHGIGAHTFWPSMWPGSETILRQPWSLPKRSGDASKTPSGDSLHRCSFWEGSSPGGLPPPRRRP